MHVPSTKQLSEAQLEVLLKSGSEIDFEVIYDRFSDALYGVLCRIMRDEALAEDALQEVFMKIWRNAERYTAGKGSIFTWMLKIARNHAIDRLRSAQSLGGSQSKVPLDDVYMAPGQEPDPSELFERGELEKMVDSLPEPLSILIDLVYIKGYTQAEVAEQLQIPLGTVKTRIRTGLQQLRLQLDVTKNSPVK